MPILIALAGLMGSAGVALLAADAHVASGVGYGSAGQILLFHAAAVLGGAAAFRHGLLCRRLGSAALAGLVLGALLFSGDLTLRALAGTRLFPYAAPGGGTILILGWLGLTVAAAIAGRGRR